MSTERTAMPGTLVSPLVQATLLEEIVRATRVKPADEAYSITCRGVEALVSRVLDSGQEAAMVSRAGLDDMIAEIDRKLSRQVDEILHNKEFQKLESAWRSLRFLVDRVDYRENVKVEVLHVTKEELMEDFEDAPEVVKSGLYKTVYSAEYGQFGGIPRSSRPWFLNFSASMISTPCPT